ncbi:MAG: hypothetical protein ACRDFY_00815 [Candidatus Limnocylindria bacterium]
MSRTWAAGLGLRARPRRSLFVAAGALGLAVIAMACGGPAGSTPPADGSTPASGSLVEGSPTGSLAVERIADLDLQVAAYDVPTVLEGEGGELLAAMLATLGLEPNDVELEIAIDPDGSLAIGRWRLPERRADEILSAWDEAVDGAWATATLAGEDALSGRGSDGSRAWATARDGVFVYIVTDDRELAEAAAASD